MPRRLFYALRIGRFLDAYSPHACRESPAIGIVGVNVGISTLISMTLNSDKIFSASRDNNISMSDSEIFSAYNDGIILEK